MFHQSLFLLPVPGPAHVRPAPSQTVHVLAVEDEGARSFQSNSNDGPLRLETAPVHDDHSPIGGSRADDSDSFVLLDQPGQAHNDPLEIGSRSTRNETPCFSCCGSQQCGRAAAGQAGGPHDARQPILLGAEPDPANGARFCVLADGQWREAPGLARLFLMFGADRIDDARGTWRALGTREGVERHYWKQQGRRWVDGP